ncbi:unnamed protein product, partial [Mesorhabditis belari]|uniref:Uncharacterized protein n=1 Tax=Mesorhabditis belari TaxID=2138241 RepID=A0AAF3F3B7_9BILA
MSNVADFEDGIYYKNHNNGNNRKYGAFKERPADVMTTLDSLIQTLSESREVFAQGGRTSRVQVEIDGRECVVDELVHYTRQPPMHRDNQHYHLNHRKTKICRSSSASVKDSRQGANRFNKHLTPIQQQPPPKRNFYSNNNGKPDKPNPHQQKKPKAPHAEEITSTTKHTESETCIREAIAAATAARQRHETALLRHPPRNKPAQEVGVPMFRSENRQVNRNEVLRYTQSRGPSHQDNEPPQIHVRVRKGGQPKGPPITWKDQDDDERMVEMTENVYQRDYDQRQQYEPHDQLVSARDRRQYTDSSHRERRFQSTDQRERISSHRQLDLQNVIPRRPSRFEKQPRDYQYKERARIIVNDPLCYCQGIECMHILPIWEHELKLSKKREANINRKYDRDGMMHAWADHYGADELDFKPVKNEYSNPSLATRMEHRWKHAKYEKTPQDKRAAENVFYGAVEVETNVTKAVKNLLKAQSCMRNVTFAVGTLSPPSAEYTENIGFMQKNLKEFNTRFRVLAAKVKEILSNGSERGGVEATPEKPKYPRKLYSASQRLYGTK